MIKIIGNDIERGGKKIGWVEENYVRAIDGKKLGYFEANYVHNITGQKIAYIQGDRLISEGSGGREIPLEKINEEVMGGVLPEIAKCAIYVLLD